jgi:hypothetical protein
MTRSFFRLIRATAVVDVSPAVWQSGTVISQAEAVVGRPATPGSVAGVAAVVEARCAPPLLLIARQTMSGRITAHAGHP